MYHKIATFLLIFLAAILETSLLPNFFPKNIAPNVVLVIIIIWLSRKKFEQLWVWLILAGFILDILTFSPIGINAVSFLIIAFGIGFAAKRFFVIQSTKSFFAIAALISGATLINYTLVNLLLGLTGYFSGHKAISFSEIFLFQNLFFQILGNLIIFSIIYWPIVRKNNWTPK